MLQKTVFDSVLVLVVKEDDFILTCVYFAHVLMVSLSSEKSNHINK